MVLTPVIKMELEEVDQLPESVRGLGGFGSTGK
jgi:dUTP pyrophosphatase